MKREQGFSERAIDLDHVFVKAELCRYDQVVAMTPTPIPPVIDPPKRIFVRYSLTRGDIFRWQFYLLVRNRVLIAFVLAMSLFLVWSNLRTPELAAHSLRFKIFYGVVVAGLMFFVVGLGTMLMMGAIVMFKKYRGFLGEHELEVRDEGLIERTDVNESLHRWAGFHRIASTGRHLYIYVTDYSVHIVPRRYFGSEREERVFREELERHVRAA